MLRTRLWMGAVMIALVVGVMVGDRHLGPWYPWLLALIGAAVVAATAELLQLLPANIRPLPGICYAGGLAMTLANWMPHVLAAPAVVWPTIAGVFAGFVVSVFVAEMASFREPGQSVARISSAVWLVAYLGLLPSFLAQLRWMGPGPDAGTAALALAVFVPKSCDIGAYCIGRLIGRHPMAPVLSPKKTWEGAAGGLAVAAVAAVLIDRLGPAPVLKGEWAVELGFGVTVGFAGMLGDLAESLVKRDCRQKDAAHSLPGFGGVLDVVDAILFAGPVAFAWLALRPSLWLNLHE
jgi:phosphatidate cytidylyltransferase